MAGRFFRPDLSPWNTPIPADAPIRSNSAACAADLDRMLHAGAGGIWWINRDAFTTNLYVVPDSTPRIPIVLVDNLYNPYTPIAGGDRFGELAYRFGTVGVPFDPNTMQVNSGSDKQITIVTESGEVFESWVTEFNRVDKNPALAGTWSFWYGGWIPDHKQNIGVYSDTDIGGRQFSAWGATATSLPLLAGLMTVDELLAGEIDHALHVALPDPDVSFVWPAQRGDGYSGKVIPEGSIFRIKPSVDVEAYTCGADAQSNTMMRVLARAMQRYGVIVNDKTGVNNSLSLRMEGGSRRLLVDWGTVGWDTMLGSIPRTDFEFIDPSYRPAALLPPAAGGAGGPHWGVPA